jgi:AcrR family transcriptional regulator
MPRSKPVVRARRLRLAPEARREIILAAAEDVFAQSGFAGASMDEVARRAGITKPVIYDHFDTKAALFFATAERVRDELLAAGDAVRVAGEPQASLKAGIHAFFKFVEQRPNGVRVLFVVPRSDPVAAQAAAVVQEQARKVIAAGLAPLMRGRKSWEKDAAALFMQKGLHALAEAWLAEGRPPRAKLADTAFALIWHGLNPAAARD